ncbi:MAG: hypothetical protein ABR569_05595 [Gaiellaceae bacterium]
MTRLAFLAAPAGVPFASPLRHAAGEGFTDVSALGKLEIRGDPAGLEAAADEELIRISADRTLLVVDGAPGAAAERLAAQGYRVYDMTGALAGLEVDGENLMRRLTELDLDELPAIGSIARGTPALIERREGERFRLFVPQELGHFVAEVVADLVKGLGR